MQYQLTWLEQKSPKKFCHRLKLCGECLNRSSSGKKSTKKNYGPETSLITHRSIDLTEAYIRQDHRHILPDFLANIHRLSEETNSTKYLKTLWNFSIPFLKNRSHQANPQIYSRSSNHLDQNNEYYMARKPKGCDKLPDGDKQKCNKIQRGFLIIFVVIGLAGTCCILLCAIKCLRSFLRFSADFSLKSITNTLERGEKGRPPTYQSAISCASHSRSSVASTRLDHHYTAIGPDGDRARLDEEGV
ncbi:hypothetical protein K3495_g7906 [Podosphaera aphanis]|nr:hypothetical protein K3495_g7906 [Podosphaera aphanis]